MTASYTVSNLVCLLLKHYARHWGAKGHYLWGSENCILCTCLAWKDPSEVIIVGDEAFATGTHKTWLNTINCSKRIAQTGKNEQNNLNKRRSNLSIRHAGISTQKHDIIIAQLSSAVKTPNIGCLQVYIPDVFEPRVYITGLLLYGDN